MIKNAKEKLYHIYKTLDNLQEEVLDLKNEDEECELIPPLENISDNIYEAKCEVENLWRLTK